MSKIKLFIYGTLKRGFSANHLLQGQDYLGEVHTIAQYRLYQISWHPGLMRDEENGIEVHGELWAVDEATLAKLDEYEGVPHWFTRDFIAIADRVGDVQAYFFNGPVPDDAASGDRWPLPV